MKSVWNRLSPTFWLIGLAMALGCGSAGSAVETMDYELCNGEPELRLIYSSKGTGSMSPGMRLMAENGHTLLMVDGTCQYWVLPSRPSDGLWHGAVTGQLSDEQAAELANDLAISRWPTFENASFRHPDFPHASSRHFWTKDSSFSCSGECLLRSDRRDVADLVANASEWIQALGDEGEQLSDGVRILLIELDQEPRITSQPMPDGLDVNALAVSAADAESYCEGSSHLVEGAAADTLRSYREDYLEGEYGYFHYIPLHDDQSELTYELYFRDALPYEDERGLIAGLSRRACTGDE